MVSMYFCCFFSSSVLGSIRATLFPYATLFRSRSVRVQAARLGPGDGEPVQQNQMRQGVQIAGDQFGAGRGDVVGRSEEHTSELQSRGHLVCRLLLEKKN